MFLTSVFLLASGLSFCGVLCDGAAYFLEDESVSAFPRDIPNDVEFIFIGPTSIENVDYLEYFPNLTDFGLYNSRLRELPPLSNVSGSLVNLFLSSNNISEVRADRLDILPHLVNLALEDNDLERFPDARPGMPTALKVLNLLDNRLTEMPCLPNWARTLNFLQLGRNRIRYVNNSCLSVLTRIQHLWLNGNLLTALPDIRALPQSVINGLDLSDNRIRYLEAEVLGGFRDLELSLDRNDIDLNLAPNFFSYSLSSLQGVHLSVNGNNLTCDWHARWLKMAQDKGHPRIDATCTAPSGKTGRSLSSVTLEELLATDDIPMTAVGHRVDASQYALNFTYNQQPGRSYIDCAIICRRQRTCLTVSYQNATCTMAQQDDSTGSPGRSEVSWLLS